MAQLLCIICCKELSVYYLINIRYNLSYIKFNIM